MRTGIAACGLVAVLALATSAHAGLFSALAERGSVPAPATAASAIEVAFSPEAGAERLVVATIDNAQHRLLLAAYSFTSPPVVRALIAAKKRGVDVRLVIDDRGNRMPSGQAAINLVVGAGIPTRLIDIYPIHHDKYLVVDGETVQTGSFNYSTAAARSNSENVVVMHGVQQVAADFTAHWLSRWNQGRDASSSY